MPENATKQKQLVRIFDILVFGPILIYLGASGKVKSREWSIALVILGIGTILYNGYYLLKYQQ